MKRELMDELVRWKNSLSRKPLLLRGVRQCGKTYLLKAFAKNEYENMVYINFEQNPEFASLFDKDFHTERIMTEMGILYGTSIQREKTLILLDEIQACPKAITALKYFCEEAPEYHIASAGSLIGISISKPNSYPVGKVNVKTLYPMSFKEFLMASGEEDLIKYIQSTTLHEISQVIHSRLFQYYDYYRITGGMPEVVKAWVQEKRYTTGRGITAKSFEFIPAGLFKICSCQGFSENQPGLGSYSIPVGKGKSAIYFWSGKRRCTGKGSGGCPELAD